MPKTYTQILLHVVFSTRYRTPWISAEVAPRLYEYIAGIIRAEQGVLYSRGGTADHIHLYLRWRPDAALSDLLRTVKARSSLWIHKEFPALNSFAWQEGYSAFAVSKSQESAVKSYIANQAKHHEVRDFQSELLSLLVAHGVDFDERFVFE